MQMPSKVKRFHRPQVPRLTQDPAPLLELTEKSLCQGGVLDVPHGVLDVPHGAVQELILGLPEPPEAFFGGQIPSNTA